MRSEGKIWALIRYAGSAPEASIGSKPLGSELVSIRGRVAAICQGILDIWPFSSRLRQGGLTRHWQDYGVEKIAVSLHRHSNRLALNQNEARP